MNKRIIELERENSELKNTIIAARSEKAKMAGIINEVNNKLKRLVCREDETSSENTRETVKHRLDCLQKIKTTGKRGIDEEQKKNKKVKTETAEQRPNAEESPDIIVIEN